MAWPHPVTIVGFLGGISGAIVMTALMHALGDTEPLGAKFLATVAGGRARSVTAPGVSLQLLGGGLVGAFVPWVVVGLAGLPGTTVTTLPSALAVGFVVAAWLFAVSTVLVRRDVTPLPLAGRGDWVVFAALHLVFGLVLSGVLGLSRDVWYPMIGL